MLLEFPNSNRKSEERSIEGDFIAVSHVGDGKHGIMIRHIYRGIGVFVVIRSLIC